MNIWHISDEDIPSKEQRKELWEIAHKEKEYQEVFSVTEDLNLRETIIESLRSLRALEKVLIPGCGSRTFLQEHLSDEFPEIKIVCSDFSGVVSIPRMTNNNPNIEYIEADTSELAFDCEFDAVIIVNSILSPSHQENQQMLSACYNSLKEGGILVGLFPTLTCSLEIDSLHGGNTGLQIDCSRSSLKEDGEQGWQIFYTPLRLRKLIIEARFQSAKYELFFLDSEHCVKELGKIYGLKGDDVCIYEIFVTAVKNRGPD